MRRIVFVGVIYFIGISICSADGISGNYSNNARMQLIAHDLDKIETARVIPNPPHPVSVVNPIKNKLEFSQDLYWTKFNAPKLYSQKGFMSGYTLRYAHRFSTDPKSVVNMFGLQAQWADGKVKQPPYDGPAGIKDRTFELRGIIGKDLYPAPYVRTTPYVGYGYRYLKDDMQGLEYTYIDPTLLETVTVPLYNRFSHYNYFPIGVDIAFQQYQNYSVESNLEYDYMFYGWEVNKLGVYPGYSTLVSNQTGGSGFRGSLRLNLYFKYVTAFAEGFYRYWYIPRSNNKADPTDSTLPPLNEPKNNTQEFGFRLGVQM